MTSHSYFVVMLDYGTDVSKVHGMEAVVHPEDTRRQIIEQVRDVLQSDSLSLVHVKFIDGNYCEDMTADILAEADTDCILTNADGTPLSPVDRQQADWDHLRDLKKHEATV